MPGAAPRNCSLSRPIHSSQPVLNSTTSPLRSVMPSFSMLRDDSLCGSRGAVLLLRFSKFEFRGGMFAGKEAIRCYSCGGCNALPK